MGLGIHGSVPSLPCDLLREVVRDALAVSLGSRSSTSFSGVGLNDCEHSENVWLIVSVARSNIEDVKTPLAVDFSFMKSPNESFSGEDIWDGENVNSGMVSKWVASKLTCIVATIGVAFLGY